MSAAAVLSGSLPWAVDCADVMAGLRQLPDDSVDLVFTSPPYEKARLYLEGGKNLSIARATEAWVAWLVEVITECTRVCRGLVAFVVEGQTKNFRYSAGPLLLMADLHRAGFNLRKPPAFQRVGIPGSGGPDWLRNDYEFVVCVTPWGKLPWSDPTACGHPPKWAPGGEMSYRNSEGTRRNQWGSKTCGQAGRPHHFSWFPNALSWRSGIRWANSSSGRGRVAVTSGHKDGDTPNGDSYDPPVLANPGNVSEQTYEFTASQLAELLAGSNVTRHVVGGGVMGHKLAHKNEAPFPETLSDFFVKSFCPPGGIVLDPFVGSGTALASAVKHGRRGIGFDLRQSQVDLARERIANPEPERKKKQEPTPEQLRAEIKDLRHRLAEAEERLAAPLFNLEK